MGSLIPGKIWRKMGLPIHKFRKGQGAKSKKSPSEILLSPEPGRVMSRTQAKKNFTIEEFEESMRGVVGTVDIKYRLMNPLSPIKIFLRVMELQREACKNGLEAY